MTGHAHRGRIAGSAVAVALLACCAAAARADDGSAPEAPPFPDRTASVRWARFPPNGTWLAGAALEARGPTRGVSFSGDAMRMRDPRPDAEDVGALLLAATLRLRLAGDARLSLHGLLAGSLFAAVIGDVGIGAPGVGAGLSAEWRPIPSLSLAGSTVLTVPFPIADSSALVRLEVRPLAISLGWRDVRFLPVLRIPGRYSSGPQLSIGLVF